MSELRQRREPIRSQVYLAGSRGEDCKIRFDGCRNDRETVVPCHIHDLAGFGMASKSDDTTVVDGCFHCHTLLDQNKHGLSAEDLFRELLRATHETLASRALRSVYPKMDKAKPFHSRPAKPRLPPELRQAIPTAKRAWGARKMESRNDLRRKETT
jgi:hypothetical protein